ncbi:hypothetical protein [Microbacterium sp. APC 3901]|uniref:hypothetical protein n=1 Tax=Microbacterium sp. APC 3901 TaxID=3035192 RepID=UPI0025B50D56|nr:hypothetical protein [Microbacterium sp. APC 3901]MDN3444390.1 hypothetical protein [Microbacterium sp. APC 3901]
MGLFQQRSDDEENQWTLPSEPLERSESEVLDEAPAVDPLSIGLGLGAGVSVSSVAFPVAPPPPESFSVENREPDPDPED